jgi:hypothetical protein
MKDIVLFCKSYRNDLGRILELINSINQFNTDNISFYLSVPKNDYNIFKDNINTNEVNLLNDEDIYQSSLPGYLSQQVIKSNFWRLGECYNYLCLDSDSKFIKPFTKNDFMFNDEIPYTVCHQQKQLFEWSTKKLSFDPQEGFKQDRQKVMDVFGRNGIYYDFGPSPTIWSSKVWEYLDEVYTKPNKLTFNNLIEYCASEFSWYGEALLSMGFPIYPLEPLFKVYHYKEQYIEDKQHGITTNDLTKNYLGIILQSNWGAPINF